MISLPDLVTGSSGWVARRCGTPSRKPGRRALLVDGADFCCPPTWRSAVRQRGACCPSTGSICCPFSRARRRALLHDSTTAKACPVARPGQGARACGGEACSDIEHLRAEARLFGFVASDSTRWRDFHEITSATRDEVKRARWCAGRALAEVVGDLWQRCGRARRRRQPRRDPQRGEGGLVNDGS